MIASYMAYLLIASLLLTLGGWGVEALLRSVQLPTRFVWMAVLLGTTVLAMAAPLRIQEPEVVPTQGLVAIEMRTFPSEAVSAAELPVAPSPSPPALTELREAIRSALERPIALAAQLEGERGGIVLGIVWGALSLLLIGVGSASALRYRAARRLWPFEEIEGVRVRVSPRAGPVVMGVLRPEIVVPQWLLASSPEERRLALLHEREHLRAGDSILLAVGCTVVALLPWNPLVWFMLSRLRLAMEVDCDARVLRHGIEQRFYGAMLIDVSGHSSGLSLGSPALAGLPSHLERRLRAMTTKRSTGALLRGGVVGTLGIMAMLAACDVSMPTAAEIQAMDAETTVEGLERMGIIRPGQAVQYTVDGVAASEEEVRAIAAEEIGMIRSSVGSADTPTAPTRVSITTRSFRDAMDPSERGSLALRLPEDEQPLYLIDNVPATAADFNRLNPEDIESISLLKDASAVVYGHRARNGVVLVVTKGVATRRDAAREQLRVESPESYEQLMSYYREGSGNQPGAPAEPSVVPPTSNAGESASSYEYYTVLPSTDRIPVRPAADGTAGLTDAIECPRGAQAVRVTLRDGERINLCASWGEGHTSTPTNETEAGCSSEFVWLQIGDRSEFIVCGKQPRDVSDSGQQTPNASAAEAVARTRDLILEGTTMFQSGLMRELPIIRR